VLELAEENFEVNSNLRQVTRYDFETVVDVLGNPIRRQIIRKLSEGPDYALRISNELNVSQQLASKHLKVIRNAELVDVIRQKSHKGADKKMFSLNKFYSLQIDFSPSLYNERLISFNNPRLWINADNYIDRLEDQVKELSEEECGIDIINPLGQIVSAIDDELDSLENRRARLLYIRNLALNSSQQAMDELDRHKRQIVHIIMDQGPSTIEYLSRYMQLREQTIQDILKDLEHENLVTLLGDTVYFTDSL
jgi:predicted transcriptional regulator